MFGHFRTFIHLFILFIISQDDLKCNCLDSEKGLFPLPKYDFLNESDVELSYERCLYKINAIFNCDECIDSSNAPKSVDNKIFCCFYYKQIDCTFSFLTEKLDEYYSESDNQYINGLKRLSQDFNQTLKRIESKDECIPYKSGNPEDCELDNSVTPSGDTETSSRIFEEEDAWSVVLAVTCVGAILIGITLLVSLIYLTNVERKHFLAIRNSQTFERIEYID